jgi:vitamin B12 transporter
MFTINKLTSLGRNQRRWLGSTASAASLIFSYAVAVAQDQPVPSQPPQPTEAQPTPKPPSQTRPGQRAPTQRPAPARQTERSPQPAQAQQPQAPQETAGVQLGVISVTSPTAVATPLNEVPNSVTVITADDIQRDQRQTLPDALMNVPGMNVVQTGGAGGTASVFMRGTNADHVKVLVDGIDVSNPGALDGSFDFSQMLTGDISRIEVLRGPQSGLYGSDAIGGVISITTKTGQGPPKAVFQTEAGSFGTFNQSLSVSGSQDKFSYYVGIQHWQSASTPVTPLNLLQPGAQRNNDFYDNKSYTAKLGYEVTDDLSVSGVIRYTDAKLRFTGDGDDNFNVQPDATQSTSVVHNTYSRAEAVYSLLDGRIKNYFGMSYTEAWNQNLSPQTGDNGIPPGFGPSTNIGVRIKEDWRSVVQIAEGQTVVIGADDEQFRLYQDNPQFSSVTFAQNSNKGAYVELQSEFYKHFFLVSNLRYDDNAEFGTATTYRIAPAFIIPGIDTKLKASYGTGFKAPTLEQLFVSFPAFNFFANPNLKPESSVGYDYGFEQPLLNDMIRFGMTYFHNNITNLIDTNATFTSYANIGLATTYGNESFVSWKVYDRLTLRFDYTYTTAKDDLTGLDLLRRPKNKETYTAIWKPLDQLSLSANILHVGPWKDVNRPGTETNLLGQPYTTVNLAANYTVNDQVTVFARVDNLFNVQYENPIGFDRPGLGIYGGLRLTSW